MTEPLYHHDAYLAAFDATVTAAHPDGVVLDRSAFFPGGGGQPADTGVLEHGGGRVTVGGAQRRDGDVVLLLAAGPVPPGLDVVRVIDIDGLDRQADGGTHVARTAEVGTIRVVGHESKGKGNKRLRIALDAAPAGSPTGA